MGQEKHLETAIFAGGCFWCVASAFEKTNGVVEVLSGYTGGHVENPSYEEVCSGTTGHAEAVKIIYDPKKISYWNLLEVFFRQIDPTDAAGSFVDRGSQYRSAVFFYTPEQERLAHTMIARLNASKIFNRPIATQVVPAQVFYPAEDYHQDYHTKNPARYTLYRTASGRDQFIQTLWKKTEDRIFSEPPDL